MIWFIVSSVLIKKRKDLYLALGIVLYDGLFLQLMTTVRHWLSVVIFISFVPRSSNG